MSIPDLAPALPSRLVTIDAVALGEDAPAAGEVTVALPYDLHDQTGERVIRGGAVTVRLVDGHAEVRLPCHVDTVTREDGRTDWVLVVKKSWSSVPYAVRVPAGTAPISLVDLTAVRELTRREAAYAITGVGLTVVEGSEADGDATLHDGILDLTIQVPPFSPQAVYPRLQGMVDEAEADLRADLYQRLAWVQSVYEFARSKGFQGTPQDFALQGIPASWAWAQITGKPATFPPTPHTHPWAEVTGKPSSFPPAQHAHTVADVTGLEAALQAVQADTGWTTTGLELGTGYTIGAGVGDWAPLAYKVRGGYVTVSGVIRKSSATVVGEAVCRLPAGARPSRMAYMNRGSINPLGQVLCPEVAANGVVAIYVTAPL